MNYYIQGDAANADRIRAAFKEKGYDMPWPGGCANPDVINIGVERNGAKYVVAETAEYIKVIVKNHPDYQELELPVEPKFKVGDEIKTGNTIDMIAEVGYDTRSYYCVSGRTISFENEDLWHLAPKPHYDISNFEPFDKVLVRCGNDDEWMIEFFCKYDTLVHTAPHRDYPFMGIGDSYSQCIPFNEETKHLLGTTDMCPEEYINW